MKVSDVGRALIDRNEGDELHAYPDPATGGKPWTIGRGHTAGVYPGMVITQAQSDKLFDDDLDTVYGPHVEKLLAGAPTTQAQFDAMVSLAYNIGEGDWENGRIDRHDAGGFEDSSILKHHLRGEYLAAADAFALWNKAGGRVMAPLTRRRLEEEKLYLSDLPAGLKGVTTPQKPVTMVPTFTRIDCAKAMQSALRDLGLYTDKIDGDWGPNSRMAYVKFLGV